MNNNPEITSYLQLNTLTIDSQAQEVLAQGLKDNSSIVITDDKVVKATSQREIYSYQVLDRYAAILSASDDTDVCITVPQVLDQIGGIIVLSRLPDILPRPIGRTFGQGLSYCVSEYSMLLMGLQKLRNSIPISELYDTVNYESDIGDVMRFVSRKNNDPAVLASGIVPNYYPDIERIYADTQGTLSRVPSFTSHKDLIPPNISLTNNTVSLIDWETMGAAQPGYDEARLYVHLSLEHQQQVALIQAINDHYSHDPIYQATFWRTVASRAYKELTEVIAGGYDRRIYHSLPADAERNRFRKQLQQSLFNTLMAGIIYFKS